MVGAVVADVCAACVRVDGGVAMEGYYGVVVAGVDGVDGFVEVGGIAE